MIDASRGLVEFVHSFCVHMAKPMPEGTSTKTVKAEINHGRWIVRCPNCPGAEMADKEDKRFFCLSCDNKQEGGKWLTVKFPRNADKIEELLKDRKRENQNWLPGETLAQLTRENRKAGDV